MIDRVSVQNFKSLRDVTVELSRLTVLVGPNGAGKSSLLQAAYLASKSGEGVPNEGVNSGYRFGQRFSGAFDPRRVAGAGATLSIRLEARGNDTLCLRAIVPDKNIAPDQDRVTYVLDVTGPKGQIQTTAGLNTANENPFPVLADPRVTAFAACEYLHLDAAELVRTTVTETEVPTVAPNGSGLASALAWLAGAEHDAVLRIAQQLAEVVPGVKAIRTLRERVSERVFEQIDIDGQPVWRPRPQQRIGDRFEVEFKDGPAVPADLLSEGTVLALGLLTVLNHTSRPRLVLLDDIDRGLHIEAQANLVKVLRRLLEIDPDLQVVCTTHSPYLLDLFDASEVRVLALDAHRNTHALPLTAHPEFERYRYGIQTGELWATLGDAWVNKDQP